MNALDLKIIELKPAKPGAVEELYQFFETLTPNTNRCLQSTLKAFFIFNKALDRSERAALLLKGDAYKISEYIAYIQKRPGRYTQKLTSGSVTATFKRLKRIYNWLKVNGYRKDSPFDKILFKPTENEVSHPTGFVEFERIVPTLEALALENTVDSLMYSALFAVLFFAGVRRSEALEIRLCDVQGAGAHMAINCHTTKAGRSRVAPIAHQGAVFIELYRKQLLVMERKPTDLMFPIASNTLYNHFKAAFGVSPHAARATFVTKVAAAYGKSEAGEAAGIRNPRVVDMYIKRKRALEDAPAGKITY